MKSLAPSPNVRHWAIRLTVAAGLALATACIIGPKQDDPEAADLGGADVGAAADTFVAEDTNRTSPDASTVPGDDGSGGLVDGAESPDTAPPAKTDGGCGDAGDASEVGCEAGGTDAVADG